MQVGRDTVPFLPDRLVPTSNHPHLHFISQRDTSCPTFIKQSHRHHMDRCHQGSVRTPPALTISANQADCQRPTPESLPENLLCLPKTTAPMHMAGCKGQGIQAH